MRGKSFLAVCAMACVSLLCAQTGFASGDTSPDTQARISYLEKEGTRIAGEAKRIAREANRLRSEALRLGAEQTRLLSVAAALDTEWQKAREASPETVRDYPGRDRSQRIIKADASRISSDVSLLQANAVQLDNESVRLEQLSADVFELIMKVRGGSGKQPQSTDLLDLRNQIRAMARTLSLKWEPA